MTTKGITGDFHTHTDKSHGSGNARDNVLAARDRKLDFVAITDHGFAHKTSGISKKNFKIQKKEIEELNKEFSDIQVLHGIEANILSTDGDIDFPTKRINEIDVLLCGYHYTAITKKFWQGLKFLLRAFKQRMFGVSRHDIIKNTDCIINTLENNPIDILTHPGYAFPLNYKRVGECCARLGTYVEISSKHHEIDAEDIKELLATECKFVLSSDAHKPEDVGGLNYSECFVEMYNIPIERVVNMTEGLPSFRSAEYKSKVFGKKDEHNG